jgi:putative nucleotidyltransferase with HDIG domain
MRAVGPAHQFLSKPCDAELLVTTIKRAVALHDTLSNGDLAALIASIDTLPSLPGVYEELHQIVLLDETSIDQVGALVSQDLAMTAKVLQLVNSSFFGLPHRVTEARHAVTLLGLDRVRPLAMMAGVFCQFEQTAFPVATLPRLVHHSLAVATTARRIAEVETSCNQTIEDAFLAGMLHDLGMQIFMSQLPDEYPAVIELAQTKQVPIWEAEFESFGTNHALVGAYLLSLWGLPDPVIEAIAWHHRPGQFPGASFTPLTAVHVANALQAKHSPLDPENLITQVDFAYLEQLDLTHRIPVWQGLADTIMAEEVVQ